MSHVASSPHEIKSRLFWGSNGAAPYFVLGRFVRALDGGTKTSEPITTETPTGYGGAPERARVDLNYHDTGKIAPRPSDARDPSKSMWEFTLRWRGEGERNATFQIKPRWKGMKHIDTGDPITTPFDTQTAYSEGVEAYVQGSNLEPDEYLLVLREACRAVAHEVGENWRRSFFHPNRVLPVISRIHAHERYLRVHRSLTDDVVGSEGIYSKLQQLYATEKGSHVRLDLNNTETVGYQTRAELPDHSVGPLPGVEHGVKLEWYHPKKVRGKERLEGGDALAHPKHEVLFRMGGSSKTENLKLNSESVPWEERHDLVRELEEFLINTLDWAGVPVESDAPNVFVPDQHFKPVPSERRIQFHEDPTPEMEATRESALVRTLAEAKGRDVRTLEALVADGGNTNVHDLAEEVGSLSTVYRALSELDELLENQNGIVGFVCQKIHEDLREVFSVASGQVEYARRATERLLSMNEGSLERAGSALQKWAAKYGASVRESDSPHQDHVVKIQSMLGRTHADARALDLPALPDVIQAGYEAWIDAGLRPSEFREAVVHVPDGDGGTFGGRAHRWIT